MIRAIRRLVLQYRIDSLLADMSVVADGIAQARQKITAGEEWSKGAIDRLRKMRTELARITPARDLLSDVMERKL